MTGQGQGRGQFGSAVISVEVRAVNNRHLKLQIRTSDGLGGLEPRIEALVRSTIHRGSLQLNVQVVGGTPAGEYRLQLQVIESYLQQCQQLAARLHIESHVTIGSLLALPGVVIEPRSLCEPSNLDEGLVEATLEAVKLALHSLNAMRRAEGASIADELVTQLGRLNDLGVQIEARAPEVVDAYRTRLSSRIATALADVSGKLQDADLAREILIMADKADIREELVRLRSHIGQFEHLLGSDESQGRKFDFLIQELFREANTIGSKANDAEIAQRVVDIKTIIEQMREQVQNVE